MFKSVYMIGCSCAVLAALGPWHARAENAVKVFDRAGQAKQLIDARPVSVSDDKSLAYVCDRMRCVLLQDDESGFIVGVPLPQIVSAGRSENGRFQVVTESHSVFVGKLLSGLRGQPDNVIPPSEIYAFEVAPDLGAARPDGQYRTGWSPRVTHRNGYGIDLQDAFVLDQFGVDGVTTDAQPICHLAFRSADLLFYVPLERITSLRRSGEEGPHRDRLEFPPGHVRKGTVLTWRTSFRLMPRRPTLHAPDRGDYLVGQQRGAFYVVPLPDVSACESTTNAASWTPEGPRIHLLDRQTQEETVVAGPAVDVRLDEGEEAVLSSLGELMILRTGELGYVGVPMPAVRVIEPAAEGRVVIETRQGGVFAGQPLSTVTGTVYGAQVVLAPQVFHNCSAQFLGDWSSLRRQDPVAPTGLEIQVVLRGGNRRMLSSAFVVDRAGQGSEIRMLPATTFPIMKDGLRHLVDLLHVQSIERMDDAAWQIRLRSSDSLQGPPAFARPHPPGATGAADDLDFIVGHGGGALQFIPLRHVKELRVDLSPGTVPPSQQGFPLSSTVICPVGGPEIRVSNVTFRAPARVPLARKLAGRAPALYVETPHVARILHLRAVSRIELNDPQTQSFRIVGSLAQFDARLCGPVQADVVWGRVEADPQNLSRIDVKAVSTEYDLLPPQAPPLSVEVDTRTGGTISWDRAWLADLYLQDGRLQVRFPATLHVSGGGGEREIPFGEIRRIRFDEQPPSADGTACTITAHGHDGGRPVRLKLLSRQRGDTQTFGPLTYDCLVGERAADCLEVIAFGQIRSVTFVGTDNGENQ